MRVASGPDPPGSSRCVFRRRRTSVTLRAGRQPDPRPADGGMTRSVPTARRPRRSGSTCPRSSDARRLGATSSQLDVDVVALDRDDVRRQRRRLPAECDHPARPAGHVPTGEAGRPVEVVARREVKARVVPRADNLTVGVPPTGPFGEGEAQVGTAIATPRTMSLRRNRPRPRCPQHPRRAVSRRQSPPRYRS